MDFTGLVWKWVLKINLFGLKSGQDFKNRAAHPHQEFAGVPPRGYQLIQSRCKKFHVLKNQIRNPSIWQALDERYSPQMSSGSRTQVCLIHDFFILILRHYVFLITKQLQAVCGFYPWGDTRYDGLIREAPPVKSTFFRLQEPPCQRMWRSEVYTASRDTRLLMQ